jgi:hypothetical protein
MRDVRGNYSGRKSGLRALQAQNRIRRSDQLYETRFIFVKVEGSEWQGKGLLHQKSALIEKLQN